MTELLPCPFCACPKTVRDCSDPAAKHHLIFCMGCGATVTCSNVEREKGVTVEHKWNTRDIA